MSLTSTNSLVETAGVPFKFKVRFIDDAGGLATDYNDTQPLTWIVQSPSSWTGQQPTVFSGTADCVFIGGECTLSSDSILTKASSDDPNSKTYITVGIEGDDSSAVFLQEVQVLKGAPAKVVLADAEDGPDNGANAITTQLIARAECYKRDPDDGRCYKDAAFNQVNEYPLYPVITDTAGNYIEDNTQAGVTFSADKTYLTNTGVQDSTTIPGALIFKPPSLQDPDLTILRAWEKSLSAGTPS